MVPQPMRVFFTQLGLCLLPLLSACRIDPGVSEPPVILRPRLTATTETTAWGTMQSETGLHLEPGSALSMPGYWRFGLSESTEAYLGGDTYRWDFDRDVSGPGDLLIGFRHRMLDEWNGFPALAFQAETKLPTAQSEDQFGTEVIDFRVALIAGKYVGDTQLSVFAQSGYLGEEDGGGTDFELSLAGSILQPMGGRWSWYMEGISVNSNERDLDLGYVGGGVNYRLGGGSLIDLAVVGGFGDAPQDTQILVGYTRNVGAFYRLR